MSRLIGIFASLFALLLLAACIRYPLDMTEEEWLRLTPAQQQEARIADAELRRAQAEQAAAEAAARALEERNRLIEAYRNARPGDIVYCEIDPPENSYGRILIQPASVTLVDRESRRLQVLTESPRRTETVWLSRKSGGNVELCESNFSGTGPVGACDSIWSIDMAFGRPGSTGISWVSALRGGTLTCETIDSFGSPFGVPPYLL
ncbi:MAG: hypothetical protein AAF414_00930 [Pseudomonadota bacterium]